VIKIKLTNGIKQSVYSQSIIKNSNFNPLINSPKRRGKLPKTMKVGDRKGSLHQSTSKFKRNMKVNRYFFSCP